MGKVRHKNLMELNILIGIFTIFFDVTLCAYVSDVEPDYGSLGGETRLTVYGGGFSADQFSQNDDPNTGNSVYLVSESGSKVTCKVFVDGSTEDQIMCYAPEKMSDENYYVKVMVDGVAVDDSDLCGGNPWSSNCRYRPSASYTPSITKLTPQSGLPGEFVTMSGKIFTERYGSNLGASSNERTEKLLRIFVGPQDCGMKDGDDFYGLALVSDTSDDGYITCQSKGISVGYYNASFIVEPPFGRSLPDDSVYRVSSSDEIYMYQIYTDITSVSPTSGSTEGGLILSIYGNYFDEKAPYTAPRAYIGDTECTITNVVVDSHVECTVAADPEYMSSEYEGNRGVTFEYWNSTSKSMSDIADVRSLNDSDPGYMTEFLDDAYHYDKNEMDNYVSRMRTFFTPPHDGEYSFMLRADDGAKLFVDNVEVLSATYDWAYSSRVNLTTANKYLLEVVHFENGGDSYVQVGAKFFDTQFTRVWTGKAEQEKQTIAIRSKVVFDVQELTFSDFSNSSYTKEVQTLEITTSGYFRLGLYGVYTESLSLDDDESVVSSAFNALPVFDSEESVTVVRNPSSASASFSFTFDSKRGDFPQIDVIEVFDNPVPAVAFTEDTKGVPDVDYVALKLGEAVSLPFSVTSLDAAGLETVLDGLFGAQCPEVFATGTKQAHVYESFEAYGGKFSGGITKETEPFCGRHSLKNPNKIFAIGSDDIGVSLSQFSQLCFAYKGLIQDYIWLKYSYKDAEDDQTKSTTTRYNLDFKRDSDIESTTWYYTCFDMMSHVSGTRPSDTNIRLTEVSIARSIWDSDIFVDALFIGSTPTVSDFDEVNLRRRPAAMPNGAIINTATVTSATANEYTVTLKPFECGDQFPLFELANSQKTSGEVYYPSMAASYRLSNSGSGTLSVSRTSHASPPVKGNIDVEFKGKMKTDLNVSLTDTLFGKELESLIGIGDLSVEKSGDCANFEMAVTFMSLAGDQPEMIVTSDGLSGIEAEGSIVTNTDGGLFYTPLTGDMLSTIHDTAQVRLFINDVPTKCSGDCSFQWSSGVTPSVTDVSPTSGAMALGTSVVISGSGFDTDPSNNAVVIGGVSCTVTGSTANSVTCNVGVGPVGAHKVMVTVAGKGHAEHTGGDVLFSYDADVTAINPAAGSQGGGITLTVTGYGFTDSAMVMVGAGSCDVIDITTATITCTLPASASPGTVDVIVMQDSANYSYTGFNYDASLTPVVSSILPSTVSVGGDTITVSGSNLGVSGTVSVGDVNGDIVSYSDTEVVFEVSGLSAGAQDVKVGGNNGYALSGISVPIINVDLSVTNVYPLSGSLQGGTRLTVTGSGFGDNSSLVEVDVGDVICDVESVTNNQIVCLIADSGKVHDITNLGTHRAYGIYYAFDVPQLTIERGDFVHWSWETPDFVNDINHAIIEVESLSSTVAMEGGFSSGTPSRNGNFQYQFTQLGTFYVWSGYVDVYGIKNYAGQIEVVEKMSKLGEISVRVDGIESLYTVGGSADPVDSSLCKSVTSAKSGCMDALPTGGDPGKFNFAFWSCATPVIDMVDQNNGTAKTTITITGEGFSTTDCQNEIMFSDYGCSVRSSTESAVTCSLDKSYEPELGVYHPISIRVGNRGNALVNIMSPEAQSFGVIPNIESITPTVGSLAGGAMLTIAGFGYDGSLSIQVGGYPCLVVESSYTEIICETPSSLSTQEVNVEVYVMVNGAPQKAECETENQLCKYTYSSSWTPTVSAINTPAMSGATTFTITGTNFGTDTSVLEVYIGTESASVMSSDGTSLVAMIQNVPAGSNSLVVRHSENGKADGSLTVTGTPVISSVVPSSGSIYGETEITINGNGFVDGDTSVTVGGNACVLSSVSLSRVICTTPAGSSGSASIVVTSNSVSYSPETFNYAPGSTPIVTLVSPSSGLPGNKLTITGINLAGSDVMVLLDGVPCNITVGSSSEIQCTLGAHATGLVPVYVFVAGLGASNVDVEFKYTLQLSSINPSTGGTAGGQTVTLSGQGFSDGMSATICGMSCTVKQTTSTDFECRTPANSAQTCDVVVSINGLTETLSNAYTYDAALTPTITGVTPTRGGTGGGTTLTVSGSGFGLDKAAVSVMIDGVVCTVNTVINTELECETGQHTGSVRAMVEVEVSGNGIAQESSSGDSEFFYIDVWSSSYTWGGETPPQEGEFVVIPAGQTLLLDTDTPVLSFLLIQGGQLIFDEKDVELQANIIMITDGGLLLVGTEAEPFQHKAIITLHGHHRSRELPIYGTKVLAVRNGSLELHGKEVPLTWTKLAATATAGSSTIQLVDPVEWNKDDEIVIAATGHHHSQSENEKKTITAISEDKMTLTLDSPLEASHLGVEETFDGTLVEMRGEVGLLTHNVVVRGNRDPQWTEFIEKCPAGFNTGEFAVQTCFLGRFGDEIGSSQFGGMILVHAPEKDTHAAEARLSYIEVTFAGQAFRLGRYPVHFHLNGDMSTSYVRGLSIHETFNRAVNVHGVHNTMVEKTVIYNVMGGAMFLEDGIETGNTFQYNLAVFVRESSSLLNDDITPASFWVTNPNNTIQHNAAAGGSHFGFWYRMHSHPDGPSFTKDVCPDKVPLGVFQNNSAHSFGWFGLWMFTNYFPMKGGCGGTEVEPAVFRSLTAWNNDKGAEAVNSGALQFEDFILVQNKLAGYEGKKVLDVPLYTDDSPMIKNSLIVGTTTVAPDDTQGCTGGGIVLPFGAGFRIKNVRFVNFATDCAAIATTRITGTCSLFCGGYSYHFEGISFTNSPNKATYAWDWEAILIDKDGSLTGKGENEWKVLPTTGSLPHDCEDAPDFSFSMPASMCPPQYKFHRYAFNNIIPASIEGKNLIIINQYGNSSVPFAKKRLSHKPGWMCALLDGATYKFEFENAEHITNISYTGAFYDFEANDHLIVRLKVEKFPDRLSIDGGATFINATLDGLDPVTAKYGDWEWDNVNSEIKFMVHGTLRTKRGMPIYGIDRSLSFTAFKCYYKDCIPPPDPDTVPPKVERPAVFDYWNDETLWNTSSDGYLVNIGGSSGVPQNYDNVRVEFDTWVVVNTSINMLGNLVLEGTLEFANYPGAVYELNANNIIIMGGRLIIGWPDDPFLGEASIILRGNHSSPNYVAQGSGPTIGSKALGVFGGLDLFGKDVGVTWTKLGSVASVGDNQIVLAENVSWVTGDEIVIGPSRYDPWETETFKITAVSGDGMTLTLNESLKYDHLVYSESFPNGQSVDVAAPVGLLTHNIKIIGEDYPNLYKQWHGARVLVGLYATASQTYTGYARLSNVEFVHTGQEGYTESYDARFSLAYIAVGTVSNVKPSSVTKCSFHKGFNSAIGAFGIGGLNITSNVVHHVVGNAIVTSSDDTAIINNLVALMEWTGTFQDRYETFNPRWEAGIEAMEAKRLILQDNVVTASERLGYHVPPLECGDMSGSYSNNMAFSNLIGLAVLPEDELSVSCAEYSGFISWKNHDFGLYYQNAPSGKLSNNIVVDNRQGIWTAINGPGALSHVITNKTVEISDSLIIGASPIYDCAKDVSPVSDNMELSKNARPPMAPQKGMIGLVFPNFMSGTNLAPGKPFTGMKSYNGIAGLMKVRGVTFAHFGASACLGDYAIGTNMNNDDGQHPLEAEQVTLYDVEDDYKVIYHRPNEGKINGADCVDMDCDALKKALLKDIDGTFLGHIGSVIPQSEFEWGTNPVRGLGDYRIPKEMVTELDGTRIPYEEICPNKGVIRNENCTYRSSWQAYECGEDLNYEMLIIESMDSDTETRRLSPVAVLGDGYIDLINGPQDHGWCSGYTCRKRVSTFMALVATEKEYLVHFTSTTPFHMRYTLLNTETEAIKLTVWYSRPNRLDVFVDGNFVMATNARINDLGFYVLDMPIADEYEPKLSDPTGTNKIDHERGEHTIIIKGSTPVEVVTQEVIIVSFGLPAMTVEDFYGANIVENLAAFLNIPLNKVRVVNVVSESGGSRRRKRSEGGVKVQVEIGDEPASSVNDTVSDSLDTSTLQNLASDLVNECQVGDLQASLNLTGSCESVEVPANSAEDDLIVYSTPQPDQLVFTVTAEPEYENVPLKTQPKIQAIDLQSVVITDLGTLEHPWQLEVSIRLGTGHPDAVLSGTLQVNVSNGWFNFTDLAISHMGAGYILDFNVTYPEAATNFTLSTSPFDVAGRPLRAHVVTKTSGDIVRDAAFSVGIDLRDSQTGDIITDIGWRNHTWYAELNMLGNPKYGGLSGVLTTTFDAITGRALFPNLQITGFGFFYIKFRVYSDPPGFDFNLNEKMKIMNPAHVGMVPEEEYQIQVKFDVDYDKVLPTEDKENEFEQMILSEYSNIWPDVRMKSGGIGRGSITVTFVIDGTLADVNATAYNLCESISNSTSYTFDGYTLSLDAYMTIDNSTFYGVTCGATESTSNPDEGLSAAIIAIIVVLIILVIVVVVAVVIWRCYIVKKTKTKDMCPEGPQYIGHDNKQVEKQLFQEDTFTSMKFRPPASTEIKPIVTMATPSPPAPVMSTQIGYFKGKSFRPPTNIQLGFAKDQPVKRADSGLSASTVSVHAVSPPPTKNRVSPEPTQVTENEHLARSLSRNLMLARSPSPNLLYPRDESPGSVQRNTRAHSPFEFDDARDSPMPPAEELYHGDYIMRPIPRTVTPHLPAPSQTPKKQTPDAVKKWNSNFAYS